MPTYTFVDNKTKKLTEMFVSIAEMETYAKNNPNKTLMPASPQIVSGVSSGRNKPDESFRDILRTIKKHNRGSKINTFD